MTHREAVAGLNDEHLSNLAGNIEAGNLGNPMSSAFCAVGCALSPVEEMELLERYSKYTTRPKNVRFLEHAYMGLYDFIGNRLGPAELYELVIEE